MQGLQILQDHAPKPRDLCQCSHPDFIEGSSVWCGACGGEIAYPEAAMKLFDPLLDVADARREAKFGKGL
jgi:hypothetical protein